MLYELSNQKKDMYLINFWKQTIQNKISDKELFQEIIKNAYPNLISVAFTRECVLKCKHCIYPCANRKDITNNNLKRIDQAINAIRKAGVKDLLHMGRILKNEHLPILKKYQKLGMKLHLIDNGFGANLIPLMKKKNIFFSGGVDISIDGFQQSHDINRGQGSFEMVTKSLHKWKQVADHVSILSTASVLNYKTITNDIIKLKKRFPFVKTFQISTTSPSLSHKQRMCLNKQETNNLFKDILKISRKTELTLALFRIEDFAVILPQLMKHGQPTLKYLSIEWQINKVKIIFFPASTCIAEEFPIDANGLHVLPLSFEYHLSTRPKKFQLNNNLILNNPDKSYEFIARRFIKEVGQTALNKEKKLLKNLLQ